MSNRSTLGKLLSPAGQWMLVTELAAMTLPQARMLAERVAACNPGWQVGAAEQQLCLSGGADVRAFVVVARLRQERLVVLCNAEDYGSRSDANGRL